MDATPVDAAFAVAWIDRAAAVVADNRDHLTQLDAAIGDSDHGVNLHRGFTAVRQALQEASPPPDTPGAVLALVGATLIGKVGGASGPLYGTAFRRAGRHLGDTERATAEQLHQALAAAVDGVRQLGAANPGDKTMIDALVPAVAAFGEVVGSGGDLAAAAGAAAGAARAGAEATIPLQALKGRASYLGPRSMGHEDPGAASSALILGALATVAATAAASASATGGGSASVSGAGMAERGIG